jgi:GAF domain-containing protein
MPVMSGVGMNDEGLTQALLRLLDDLDDCTLSVHDRVLDRIERALSAAGAVLGVDRVGLMLLDEHGELVAVGASDAASGRLEHVQQRLGVGPGWDAMSTGQPVAVADLAAPLGEHRDYAVVWRALQDADIHDRSGSLIGASAASCVRAVLSVPVRSGGEMVGNLNAICEQVGPWTQRQIRAVQAYADVIGTLLTLSATAMNLGDGVYGSRWDGRRA